MMSNHKIPIIVGVAQYTQAKDCIKPLDPIELIAESCNKAIVDIGVTGFKELIDALYVANIYCTPYINAPDDISDLLEISPIEKVYFPIGGNTPQMLVNLAAKAITQKRSEVLFHSSLYA